MWVKEWASVDNALSESEYKRPSKWIGPEEEKKKNLGKFIPLHTLLKKYI